MSYLKPTPTTVEEKPIGKISDGLSVKLTVPAGVKATGKTGVGITNGELTWTAKTAGIAGNDIVIIQQDPAGNDQALAVAADGNVITIALATDGSGVITSTAAEIKAAIEADAPCDALVGVVYDGTGAGVEKDENVKLSGGLDGAVDAKDFCLIDHFFGMAFNSGEAGAEVVLDLELAEYETDQLKSGDTFAVGQVVYWDPDNLYFTETPGALTAVGIVTQALDSGVIHFKLTNTVI